MTPRGVQRGGDVGAVAVRASTVASVILGIGVLLTYGLFLAAFITSLAPVLPTERDARLHLAKGLRDYQHPGHAHKHTIQRRDDHY